MTALRALAEKTPEVASKALRAALVGQRTAGANADAIEGLAADVAAQLRRNGQLDAARRLAEAGAHRTTRLALEHALAALAQGHDDEAALVAAANPDVAAVVQPMLDAVRGVEPTKAPRLPALHKAVLAASRATWRLGRGESDAARDELRGVAAALRSTALVPELGALVEVAREPEKASVLRALAIFSATRTLASAAATDARVAIAEELADAAPDCVGSVTTAFVLPTAAKQALQQRALLASLQGSAGGGHAASEGLLPLFRTLEARSFAAAEQPNASLYEGFAWLAADPARAAKAFDRAIEGGGDLVEALRGKLLACMRSSGGLCAECEMVHAGGAPERVAAAADHLAKALRRAEGGEALAGAAFHLAAHNWIDAGEAKRAAEAIQAARIGANSDFAAELDLLEIEAARPVEPARAKALLDAYLVRRPDDAGAWEKRIDMAELDGEDPEFVHDLLTRAAEATGDARLRAELRSARVERGELAPFNGFVPGRVSAGELAAELESMVRAAGRAGAPLAELPEAARACRDALAPEARLAFDAAALLLDVTSRASTPGSRARPEFEARFVEVARAWAKDPSAVAKLAMLAIELDMSQALVSAASALADLGEMGAILALARVAVAVGETSTRDRITAATASRLTRAELQRVRALGRAQARLELQDDPATTVEAFARILAPSFDFEGALDQFADWHADPDAAMNPTNLRGKPRSRDDLADLLATALATAGLPRDALDRLPAAEGLALRLEMQRALALGPDRGLPALTRAFDKLEARIRSGPASRAKASSPHPASATQGGRS